MLAGEKEHKAKLEGCEAEAREEHREPHLAQGSFEGPLRDVLAWVL